MFCIEAKYVEIDYNNYIPSRSVARNAENQRSLGLRGVNY
jgi:hypothetical protein